MMGVITPALNIADFDRRGNNVLDGAPRSSAASRATEDTWHPDTGLLLPSTTGRDWACESEGMFPDDNAGCDEKLFGFRAKFSNPAGEVLSSTLLDEGKACVEEKS